MIMELIVALVLLGLCLMLYRIGHLILQEESNTRFDRVMGFIAGYGLYLMAALIIFGLINQLLLRII